MAILLICAQFVHSVGTGIQPSMTTSCFELFKIGIGPSSSHTVGPMLAAWRFGQLLEAEALLDDLTRIQIDVYGSLAMTGHGHATDIALCMGLMGERPDQIDPDQIAPKMDLMREQQQVDCFARKQIRFVEADDLRFHFGTFLPAHPNAVTFTAFDQTGQQCAAKTYYSIGGGFVLSEDEIGQSEQDSGTNRHMPFDFSSAAELMEICTTHNRSIADVMLA
ncbi:MAG: serine dehydratase beta chain, partial [Pseudomonadota bacterium]